MDSDLHFVLVTTGTELRACPQGTSVANCKAPPLLISNMKRPRPSRDATRVSSPVVVLVSRLLFGRRSVLSEGAARGGATGDARAARATCVHRGWFSPPQLGRDIARRGGPLLFSRPVAGRRPRLASSLRSPLRAERGRGARGATGDARAARAARVHRGWFSPPQLSRDIARRGGPLLFSRPVAGRRPRLTSSLRSPLRAERGRSARGERRATRARRARRAYIAGGSHRRSSAGTSRAAVVLSSSLVPSPVVVLVSRLHFGRRSVLSEGAARGGGRATRARRARRAYIAGGSHRRSSAATSRAAVVLSSLSSCLVSRPVRRSARAPLLHSTREAYGYRLEPHLMASSRKTIWWARAVSSFETALGAAQAGDSGVVNCIRTPPKTGTSHRSLQRQ